MKEYNYIVITLETSHPMQRLRRVSFIVITVSVNEGS